VNDTLPTLGLALFQTERPQETIELAQLAERLGYSNLWFGDSQNIWRECAVTMGAAAVSTDRIRLGTGVTNLATRHLSVVGSIWATLAELSHGRAVMGIGTGYTSVGTLGRGSMTLADFEDRVGQLRQLLRGESATDAVSDSSYHLEYVSTPRRVPFYMAASGPKALRLAGRIADGVIILVGTAPQFVTWALQHVESGARSVGRELADLDVVLWVSAAVDSDPARARDRMRARVVRSVVKELPVDLEPELMSEVEALRAHRDRYAQDFYHHLTADAEHALEVSDDLVDRFALAGTPAQCRERLAELKQLGVDHVSLVPYPFDLDVKRRSIEMFGQVIADSGTAE